MVSKKLLFRRIVFINYDEMYDIVKYPLLKRLYKESEDAKTRKEDTMSLEERKSYRIELFPKKTNRCLNRNKDTMKKIGQLYEINSEVSLRDFKQSFSFKDENDKDICFVHEIELEQKQIPIDNIFALYQSVIDENLVLKTELSKKNESVENTTNNTSVIINEEKKKEIQKEFFSILKSQLFVIFKGLNEKLVDMNKMKLSKEDNAQLKPIIDDCAKLITQMKTLIINTNNTFKD